MEQILLVSVSIINPNDQNSFDQGCAMYAIRLTCVTQENFRCALHCAGRLDVTNSSGIKATNLTNPSREQK